MTTTTKKLILNLKEKPEIVEKLKNMTTKGKNNSGLIFLNMFQ